MSSYILIIAAAVLALIYLARKKFFVKNGLRSKEQPGLSMDDRYNIERKDKQSELDDLLEKINDKGIQSLSKKEKQRLQELSR